ncbi:MAG: SIS domain-containing protein [Eubacteriales bacterium]|nr:SIS domain-containing protein [Eubacteriales bacterium]
MLKFDGEAKWKSVEGALALRAPINQIVDSIYENGFKNVCWLGIGGTWASALQVEVHMKERSSLDFFSENAAEFLTTGNKKIGQGSIAVISSVTGTTEEMLRAVKRCRELGAKVFAFIDTSSSPLATMVDWCISYPQNEQLKFFMVADRLMYLNGEFPEYDAMYQNFDQSLPRALVDVEIEADCFAREFAEKHHNDALHYFVGAGNQYGACYSYAMCYWEEQHWIRTKSIHSAEFFHGMFEVIDRDSNVTVYVGEDSQRELSLRVARFLPRICSNFTIIDSKDYELKGIAEEYRGCLSHLVMHAVNNRIDVHIENLNRHPMEIRRYYRQLDY